MPDEDFFKIDSFQNTLAATATLFFIYTGFEHMAALGSEVKNPSKTIPRAFLMTMLITTVIYLFISFTVLSISNPPKLAGIMLNYFLDRRPKKALDAEEEKELFSH